MFKMYKKGYFLNVGNWLMMILFLQFCQIICVKNLLWTILLFHSKFFFFFFTQNLQIVSGQKNICSNQSTMKDEPFLNGCRFIVGTIFLLT